jgi:hypothetical protein
MRVGMKLVGLIKKYQYELKVSNEELALAGGVKIATFYNHCRNPSGISIRELSGYQKKLCIPMNELMKEWEADKNYMEGRT